MKKIVLTINILLLAGFLLAEVIFFDGFETEQGWSLSEEFEIGAPQGLGGEHGNADPAEAFEGVNVLGSDLSGNGDYGPNLDDRELYAISPNINCAAFVNVELTFMRWLNVEQSLYDHAYIDISTNNGNTWVELWTNDGTITDSDWSEMSFDISAYADANSTVKIRFSIGTTDNSWFYSGWNVDNFELTGDLISLAEIGGLITDSETGEPIGGAYITEGVFDTYSDSEGIYELSVLSGERMLTVSKENYFHSFNEINYVAGETDVINISLEKYSIPTNLDYVIENSSVLLSWSAPEYQPQPVNLYNIYRNDVLIASVNATNYVDTEVLDQAYEYYVVAVYQNGVSEPSNIVSLEILNVGNDLNPTNKLFNYPNPFNLGKSGRSNFTVIAFSLNEISNDVKVKIYNVKGQLVKSWDNISLNSNQTEIFWNGRDNSDKCVSSGIYSYQLITNGKVVLSNKMLVIK